MLLLQPLNLNSLLTYTMYKYLFLFLTAVVSFSACDNDPKECLCPPRIKCPEAQKAAPKKLQIDEFGEYIPDSTGRNIRADSTDHGDGFIYMYSRQTARISKARFDSLFTKTVWKIHNLNLLDPDDELNRKYPVRLGGSVLSEFTFRDGKAILGYEGVMYSRVIPYHYEYDEQINRVTFPKLNVTWDIIRLTKHAVEFIQHGDNLWGPYDWYYYRNSGQDSISFGDSD